MQEMNYQPNELARSLAKAHSNTIGVIVPHISHPFFSKMISALESAAAKRGYKILLCNSKDQPEKETEYLDMFISNRVTGVVMASRDVQIEKFHDLKIPIVNFEREENTEAITIQCDNEQGGALAASHLADCAAAICFISAESSEEICRRTGVRMDSCASAGSGGLKGKFF